MKNIFRKTQNLYGCEAVNNLINQYNDKGGECLQLSEGGCGCGDWILFGKGLKTCIIKEVVLNEWSSAHTVRLYRKTPKKYQKIIDENF